MAEITDTDRIDFLSEKAQAFWRLPDKHKFWKSTLPEELESSIGLAKANIVFNYFNAPKK